MLLTGSAVSFWVVDSISDFASDTSEQLYDTIVICCSSEAILLFVLAHSHTQLDIARNVYNVKLI